jgi:DNA-binding XRE family transcriptional regulator
MPRTPKVTSKFRRQVEQSLERVSKQLKAARIAAGLTQDELAEDVDISVEMLRAIEGKRRLPSLTLLVHICVNLDIEIEIP